MFLLAVPIEEEARWQHETVLIISPLNTQSIITTLDVVKWTGRAGRHRKTSSARVKNFGLLSSRFASISGQCIKK